MNLTSMTEKRRDIIGGPPTCPIWASARAFHIQHRVWNWFHNPTYKQEKLNSIRCSRLFECPHVGKVLWHQKWSANYLLGLAETTVYSTNVQVQTHLKTMYFIQIQYITVPSASALMAIPKEGDRSRLLRSLQLLMSRCKNCLPPMLLNLHMFRFGIILAPLSFPSYTSVYVCLCSG